MSEYPTSYNSGGQEFSHGTIIISPLDTVIMLRTIMIVTLNLVLGVWATVDELSELGDLRLSPVSGYNAWKTPVRDPMSIGFEGE